jgi:DNA polymerase
MHGLKKHTWMVLNAFKRAWRQAHPAIASFWKDIEEACRMAISEPGTAYQVRALKVRRDGAWLRIKLPSGRFLCYPHIHLDDDNRIAYSGQNQYTKQWSVLNTFGGKLTENIVQAISRDILMYGVALAEDAGFPVVMRIHDELICEVPDLPEFTPGDLEEFMSTNPPWAQGLPLDAKGFEAYRYKKG